MKKILSVVAVVGMISALSASAFAAEKIPALTVNNEIGVTELGKGVSRDDTVTDIVLSDGDEEKAGVILVGDGGEYVAEIGEGLSKDDTAEDIQ